MVDNECVWMTRQEHDRLLRELAALRPRRSIEVPDDLMDSDANSGVRYPGSAGGCPDDQVAGPGKVVTVRHEATGQTETFLLGRHGAGDADITVYSTLSPLGRAILGARPGERRFYSIPHGADMVVTLIRAVPYGSRRGMLPGCAGRTRRQWAVSHRDEPVPA